MAVTPIKVSPIPRSVSDASMGYNDDDMLDSPPTRGMPDVRALADALEPPPDMAALKVPNCQSLEGQSTHKPGQVCLHVCMILLTASCWCYRTASGCICCRHNHGDQSYAQLLVACSMEIHLCPGHILGLLLGVPRLCHDMTLAA